jgi:hypothetical protein
LDTQVAIHSELLVWPSLMAFYDAPDDRGLFGNTAHISVFFHYNTIYQHFCWEITIFDGARSKISLGRQTPRRQDQSRRWDPEWPQCRPGQ